MKEERYEVLKKFSKQELEEFKRLNLLETKNECRHKSPNETFSMPVSDMENPPRSAFDLINVSTDIHCKNCMDTWNPTPLSKKEFAQIIYDMSSAINTAKLFDSSMSEETNAYYTSLAEALSLLRTFGATKYDRVVRQSTDGKPDKPKVKQRDNSGWSLTDSPYNSRLS